MSIDIQNNAPADAGQRAAANAVLPSFKALAVGAAAANAPVIALLLMRNLPAPAVSVAAGYLLGMAVYGSLYAFVTKGLDIFVASVRGTASPPVSGSVGVFILMLTLKFVGLAILVYLLLHFLQVNVLCLAVGAAITQIAVTVGAVSHMRKHKLLGESDREAR